MNKAVTGVIKSLGINRVTMADYSDMDYGHWYATCSETIECAIGISADDLPDWSWRDAYDDGCTVVEAVADFLNDQCADDSTFGRMLADLY